jgi:hypothetical protein
MSDCPPFQDIATLSGNICAGESTIENWVRMGLFPPPKKIGGKRLWEWAKVRKHLARDDNKEAVSPEAEAIRNATRAAIND